MKKATALMNKVMIALSKAGATVWRNNTGSGWAGKSFTLSPGQTYRAQGGERVVIAARPLRAGLCEGSADLIGFHSVTVTDEMVGQRLAVFAAWEVKSGSGRPTPAQCNFLRHIEANGGFARIISSVEQVEE